MKLLHHRRVKISLILTVLFVPLTYVSSQAQNGSQEKSTSVNKPQNIASFVNSQIRKGKLSYRKKEYETALEEWNKALEYAPHNTELQGLILLTKEKMSESQPETISSIPAHKQKAYVESLIRSGKLAYRHKDYQKAYSDLKEAEEIDSKNSEIQQLLDAIRERIPTIEETVVQETVPPEGPVTNVETASEEPQSSPSMEGTGPENIFEPEAILRDYQGTEPLPLEGVPLTLEQCIMIARANSLSVKIAREEAALARWKMAPARRALWPSFDAYWKETSGTTTGQDFTGREVTLEFQKPLLTWGKTKALFLQAKINWEISKRNLQKEVTELDFKTEQAYFILANALKDVQDLNELYKDSDKDLKMAEQRFKLELARELEFMKVKSKVDEIYYRVQSSEKDLILAQLTMAQILDSRRESPFTVRARLGNYAIETTLDQCIEFALKNRSDLIVNELLMEYNKLGQKVAKSEYKWNVNLEGSFGMNDEAFISETLEMQQEYFVGVKVTKPFGPHTIEDNFLTQDKVPSVGQTTSTEFTSNTLKWYFWNSTAKINIKEADIKYLKSIDEYIKKRNSIIFEVKKNYYEYLKAKQQLNNNLQKIRVAEEELKISVARLGLNEILDSELLESKDRFSRAKSEHGQSVTGYYTAVANLNKSLGLTDYFDLKRGLQEQPSENGTWQQYINEPGEIGSLPSTAGYKEIMDKLEGKKSWWKAWGSKEKAASQPRTTQELVQQTTEEGIELYKQSKYEEALNKFEAAVKLDPEYQKAQSYLKKTKSKLGIEMDEESKKLNFSARSTDADQWFDKGLSAYQDKQYEEAIAAWNKALELDPKNRRAQVYLQRAKDKQANVQTQNSK